jgi:hypothetical protein
VILSPASEGWVVGGTKHRGKLLEKVAQEDPEYLKWMYCKASEGLTQDAFYALDDALRKFGIDPFQR